MVEYMYIPTTEIDNISRLDMLIIKSEHMDGFQIGTLRVGRHDGIRLDG